MNAGFTIGMLVVAGYAFGSVPYGVLIGRAHGVDVMAAGSGNVGATNVGRLLGRRWGILVFGLDMVKGLLPTLMAGIVFENLRVAELLSPASARLSTLAVGLACVLGHNYSFLLRFRGGRGVATTLGVCLGVYPGLTAPALAAFIVWAVVVLMSRYVSLGSVAACAVFPIFVLGWSLVRGRGHWRDDWPLIAFAFLVAGLGIYRHRANLARLSAGTEPKLGEHSSVARTS